MLKYTLAALALLVIISTGCKSSPDSSESAEKDVPEKEKVSAPIPPDSPFAKIKLGMGMEEVNSIIGPPTNISSHVTGKAFNPFYYGGDTHRQIAHYKGIGTITYSPNSRYSSGTSAVSIDYDPNEPGFQRNE